MFLINLIDDEREINKDPKIIIKDANNVTSSDDIHTFEIPH